MRLDKLFVLFIIVSIGQLSPLYSQFNDANETFRILTKEEQELQDEIQSGNEELLNNYISEVLSLPIPENYTLEKKYYRFDNYPDASENLGKNKYPNFYGKQGMDLKLEIKSSPIEFKYMIFDYKLLREGYDKPK